MAGENGGDGAGAPAAAESPRESPPPAGGAAPRWAVPPRSELPYTHCYCEENVWRLLRRCADSGPCDGWYAVVLSSHYVDPARENPEKPSATFIAVHDGTQTLFWDYHMVALHAPAGGAAAVYDFDSELGWPVPLGQYAVAALSPARAPRPILQGLRLRLVPGADFLSTFASDRRHMRAARSPPPPEPCIQPQADGPAVHNLSSFVNMASTAAPGRVFTLPELLAWAGERAGQA
eukprot:TRINITY_DN72069_c0_g1_i1.p1 TRINITY_DN72069_c0_g1~~TRINITY_DN72069_c0_g1_i1.p1  ORF type:complete len:234 (+),score=45.42 TRINITY_DN72069_c0_g1_i1:83-784(+)